MWIKRHKIKIVDGRVVCWCGTRTKAKLTINYSALMPLSPLKGETQRVKKAI